MDARDGDGSTRSEAGEPICHVNGELLPESAATVHVSDRGFRYGDAAFETLRAYGGDVFRWNVHADRLAGSLDALGIERVPTREDLRGRVDETLTANGLDDAYVRLSVTRGESAGKLDPDPDADPTVVVVTSALPRGGTSGEDVWDGPAVVETVGTRRVPTAAIPAAAKTHNYLNGVLARLELSEAADEALLLDADGHVAEGATSNVFFVASGTLHTPSLDGPVLPGVTRDAVLDLAAELDVPIETGAYDPARLSDADEAFLTNTTWEVRPVDRLDDRAFDAPGPVTRRLTDGFDRLVERRHYQSG